MYPLACRILLAAGRARRGPFRITLHLTESYHSCTFICTKRSLIFCAFYCERRVVRNGKFDAPVSSIPRPNKRWHFPLGPGETNRLFCREFVVLYGPAAAGREREREREEGRVLPRLKESVNRSEQYTEARGDERILLVAWQPNQSPIVL